MDAIVRIGTTQDSTEARRRLVGDSCPVTKTDANLMIFSLTKHDITWKYVKVRLPRTTGCRPASDTGLPTVTGCFAFGDYFDPTAALSTL